MFRWFLHLFKRHCARTSFRDQQVDNLINDIDRGGFLVQNGRVVPDPKKISMVTASLWAKKCSLQARYNELFGRKS